jgi:hypothetical protein
MAVIPQPTLMDLSNPGSSRARRAEAGRGPLLVCSMQLQVFDTPILNEATGLYKRNKILVLQRKVQ